MSGAAVDEDGLARSHARVDGFGARREDAGEALVLHFVAARHAVVAHARDAARLPGAADDALNTVLRDDIGVGGSPPIADEQARRNFSQLPAASLLLRARTHPRLAPRQELRAHLARRERGRHGRCRTDREEPAPLVARLVR